VFYSPGINDAGAYAGTSQSRRVTHSTVTQPYGVCDVGHQGLVHDEASGLVWNRARVLHPGLGRFMQRDPLGYVDGMGSYLYTMSSPADRQDPSGLSCTMVGVDTDDEYHTMVTEELIWQPFGKLTASSGVEASRQSSTTWKYEIMIKAFGGVGATSIFEGQIGIEGLAGWGASYTNATTWSSGFTHSYDYALQQLRKKKRYYSWITTNTISSWVCCCGDSPPIHDSWGQVWSHYIFPMPDGRCGNQITQRKSETPSLFHTNTQLTGTYQVFDQDGHSLSTGSGTKVRNAAWNHYKSAALNFWNN